MPVARSWGVAIIAVMAGSAGAQTTRCQGEIISDVSIVTHGPYEALGTRWWEAPLRFATDLHTTTQPSVVRRFLIVKEGRPCIELERAESERILRAQPFLADASIAVIPDTAGTVALLVETRDELTPVLGVSTSGARITALKLGEGNLLGSGTYIAGQWRDGTSRDTYAIQGVDHQFLGRHYVLAAAYARRDHDMADWTADLSHPFFTDQQRFAWRASTGGIRELFEFRRADAERVPFAFERKFIDLGAVVRVGLPGRLSLFGVSFSQEEDTPFLPPTAIPGFDYDSLLARHAGRRNARVNALWGLRNVRFLRVERFEGLTATEDIRLGFQLGTLIGRSLSILNTTDDDYLLAADLYGAVGGESGIVMLIARGEGRQNYDINRWDGVLGSARIAGIRRISTRHTVTASLDWSGGWRQRIPFQLNLGSAPGGVRGYRRSEEAGARRAVARVEDRWYVGQLLRQADVGVALFADAGRVWKGDAPYGVDTPVRYSLGVSLLAAIPPRSKRTWRVDIAVPMQGDPNSRWEARLTHSVAGRDWREPGDASRSRERSVPASVFNWP
ncbi:MAG TPA: hypothetical protein VJ802_16295 [Gemmatimonadaceae bacterium]|nr:hypothetical protein [Gemmatimonadaceae bacterium]